MAALILLMLSSLGFGVFLRLDKEQVHLWHVLPYIPVVGMACWCILLFFAGLFGSIWAPVLVTGVVVGGGYGVVFLYRYLRLHTIKIIHVPKLTRAELTAGGFILFFILLTFLKSFAPVTGGIANDEIHTHLSIPAAWLRNGSITPLGYPIAFMGGNGELLFLFGQFFSGAPGARLISWAAYVLIQLISFLISYQWKGRQVACVAALLTAINPLFFRCASIAFLDTLGVLFMISAVGLWQRWREQPSLRLLLCASLCAGVGCGIKPFNVVYTGFLFLLIFYEIIRCRRCKKKIKMGVLVVFVLMTSAAPWPLRTFVLTGSPTFPPPPFWAATDLPEKITGNKIPYSKEEVQQFYRYVLSRYGSYRRTAKNAALLLWRMTMDPETFQAGDSIGSIYLSFFPLVVLLAIWRREKFLFLLLTIVLLSSAVIYFLVLPEARYFMTAMALSAIVSTALFTVDTLGNPVRIGCTVVLLVNTLFSLAVVVRTGWTDLRAIFDGDYREKRVAAERPFHEAMQYLKKYQGDDTVVVFYDSPIWYYLKSAYRIRPDAVKTDNATGTLLLLDIDYSQVAGRTPDTRTGNYYIKTSVRGVSLLFEGPDARIYKITGTGQ